VARVALLAHGAGSTADAAVRLLHAALPPGVDPVGLDARGSLDQVVAAVSAAYDAHGAGHDVALVGGISLGAHAVATWASGRTDCPDLVLAMPAWTSGPDEVAALTAQAARRIAEEGIAAELDRLGREDALRGDWVLDELVRAWAAYDDLALSRALAQAAASPGPGEAALRRITARTAVVALGDDPLHPERVARRWAGLVPDSTLVVVPRRRPDTDRAALGRAARQALDRRPSGSR